MMISEWVHPFERGVDDTISGAKKQSIPHVESGRNFSILLNTTIGYAETDLRCRPGGADLRRYDRSGKRITRPPPLRACETAMHTRWRRARRLQTP